MGEYALKTFAPAKINLGLAIVGLQEDGYHELHTVMQTISLYDAIKVRVRDEGIICRCGDLGGPQNLAYQAAEVFFSRLASSHGIQKGVEIDIEKQIPVQAGLAGGSSDAAATLRLLNKLFTEPFNLEELSGMAGLLGADVAFCLVGGTAWATGRGERLQPLPPASGADLVLVKPEKGVDTGEAYRLFDRLGNFSSLSYAAWEKALQSGALREMSSLLYNDLEIGSFKLVPEIAGIKAQLLDYGCNGALMSGSGSTVFGIAPSQQHAEQIALKFRTQGYTQVWVTKTVNPMDYEGVLIEK